MIDCIQPLSGFSENQSTLFYCANAPASVSETRRWDREVRESERSAAQLCFIDQEREGRKLANMGMNYESDE